MKAISIYIVDDHSLIIEGLKKVLFKTSEFFLVGYANNANTCLAFFEKGDADIVILDINLPDMSGILLCKMIKESKPNVKIIALSNFEQPSYIKQMLQNGAQGYLLKNAQPSEILDAIRIVMLKNGIYLSKEISAFAKTNILEREKPLLTKREKEVLKLIVSGMTNVEISKHLFLSIDTVDSHRKNLHIKLQVKNVAHLVKLAIEQDLI